MNTQEVLATLEKAGKPQTAAIYKRHGAGDNVFGALTSEIGKLKKKIKIDHALALDLWKTGNAEARALALQIADPAKLTRAQADRFLADGPVRFIGVYLGPLVARSPIADETMRAWMASSDENAREVGYAVFTSRLMNDEASIRDADAEAALHIIEREIHRSPNWARHAMNNALIAIAVAKPSLREKATDAARRIGKVVVDHGETSCKTPYAPPYIEKAAARADGGRRPGGFLAGG